MEKIQLMGKMRLRKLTKNEEILLIILIIIIVILISYRFIIKPQKTKFNDLMYKKLEYEKQIAEINDVLRNNENMDKELADLNKEKNLILGKYFPKLNQFQILYLLNDLLDSGDIHILDMQFSPINEENIGDLSVKTMDINIPYNGDYKGLIELIEGIESSPKKILISNLIIDRNIDNNIIGNIGLKIYGLEGIEETDEELVYIDTNIPEGERDNPFIAYEDFKDKREIIEEPLEEIMDRIEDSSRVNIVEETQVNYYSEILEDFEKEGLYFIPSHKNINGRLSKSTNSKYKQHSLRLEYEILAIEDENRAYIDLTDKDIIIKYPPSNIGLWVHSYSYSPIILGLGFKGQAGEKINIELSRGINWVGWKHLELTPPEDLTVYPLQLDKIYLEIAYNRDDYGVLLFDKLEANYPEDNNKSKEKFIFYKVESGDTLEKISLKNYGITTKKQLIMKYNDIESEKDLKEGKILVIPR